jgi:hypothetical protein
MLSKIVSIFKKKNSASFQFFINSVKNNPIFEKKKNLFSKTKIEGTYLFLFSEREIIVLFFERGIIIFLKFRAKNNVLCKSHKLFQIS